MKDILICRACHKEIKTNKDKYVHVEDWNCNLLEGNNWFHLKCFKKAMNRDLTILEKQAATMLNKAGNIFNNLPDEFKPKEEYVLT